MAPKKSKASEKKKDFAKPKLKVGKTRPKAANSTDTSFRAKTVVLKDQSLAVDAPSTGSAISSHISSLASKSVTQRRESLSALTNLASTNAALPFTILIPQCLTLITDGERSVRFQLVKLLQTLPAESFGGSETRLVLHLQAGLTHISMDIRSTTLDILQWAINTLLLNLVSCSGGWYKLLNCFSLFFGWNELQSSADSKAQRWSNSGHLLESLGKNTTILTKALDVLASFLEVGLSEDGHELSRADERKLYSYHHLQSHHLPRRYRAYAHLGLFGRVIEDENKAFDSVAGRRLLFYGTYEPSTTKGLRLIQRHGGALGRSAGAVQKIIARNSIQA